MGLLFEERGSNSCMVDRIWRSQSVESGSFVSTAAVNWEFVITTYQGETNITLRGPETCASAAEFPEHGMDDAEFFGIAFTLGTFMPHLPPGQAMNRHDLVLPKAAGSRFWLNGSSWEYPTFNNPDVFIKRLIREGILSVDPVVTAALRGENTVLTHRSVQAHFAHATGLSPNLVYQIERAHQAAEHLRQGKTILQTMQALHYYDQPHMTRMLKRYLGRTPTQIAAV